MRQRTLAEEGFEKYRKPTRREQFLEEMDQIILWRELCKVGLPRNARNGNFGVIVVLVQ